MGRRPGRVSPLRPARRRSRRGPRPGCSTRRIPHSITTTGGTRRRSSASCGCAGWSAGRRTPRVSSSRRRGSTLSAPTSDAYAGRGCPLCLRPGGELVHEVPTVPVHSCLVMDTRAEAVSIARASLAVVLCRGCGAMTNRRFAEQDMAYSNRYEDSQAFSSTFLDYARALAHRWVEDWGLEGRTVLEIGAGGATSAGCSPQPAPLGCWRWTRPWTRSGSASRTSG